MWQQFDGLRKCDANNWHKETKKLKDHLHRSDLMKLADLDGDGNFGCYKRDKHIFIACFK
jgi:hypothetical protein